MKTKLLAIFAAAAISLGGAAATTSAASADVAPAVATQNANVSGGVQLAHFSPYARRHHHGGRYRRMCRRLYILGFRYGNPRARRAWFRLCRGRGHGGYYRGYYGRYYR